jgi:excisionase family DNA binding protein
MNKQNKKYITTTELAHLLGISRIAVFKKIQKGQVKAIKEGRKYLIDIESVPGLNDKLSASNEKIINHAVDKTIKDYGETLRLLADE